VDGFLTSRILSDLLYGVTDGVTISLVALSLVLIWRSTNVLNFAQGAMAMFATYVGMGLLSYNLAYWWCVLISVVAGMALGGLVERTVVRRLYGKPELNPIVVMVGLLLVLESTAAAIWGSTARSLPTPFSFEYWQIGGKPFGLSPFAVFEIIAAVLAAAAIGALFRFTKIGLQLRASALAPEVSRLLGVRVGRMLTLGWVLASGVGALAAVLVSSDISGLTPGVMDTIFVFGFVAAAIGGLESPVGALVVGIALGILDAFITDFWNPNYVTIATLALLVVVLMIRPQGLFSKRIARRV